MSQDLDISLLRTFVAIVDTGGLTSAGRKVGRTQPAITHQIRRLEDLIGRTLFDDNRRKLSLTHDGEVLLEFARAMLARAIVSEPQILIVDEPITGLDPRHAMQSLQLLSAFARSGTLVIASLHDLTLAARYPGRVIVLVDGAVIGDADSLTEELVHRAFGVTAFLTGQGDSRAFTLLSPSEK